jgi:ubiquinone/menaquinone biosynthesis C-methylase UbiE
MIIEKIVDRLTNNPFLFNLFRRLLENNFGGEKDIIRKEMSIDNETVIDVGCGTGEFSVFFNRKTYVGIDINEHYIRYALRKHKRIFKVMDAEVLNFSDNSFDNAIVIGLFHHVPDERSFKILKEIRRVLKDHGNVLIMEDVKTRSKYNIIGKLVHRLDKGKFIRDPDEYAKIFSKYFNILKEYPMKSGFCDYQVFICS